MKTLLMIIILVQFYSCGKKQNHKVPSLPVKEKDHVDLMIEELHDDITKRDREVSETDKILLEYLKEEQGSAFLTGKMKMGNGLVNFGSDILNTEIEFYQKWIKKIDSIKSNFVNEKDKSDLDLMKDYIERNLSYASSYQESGNRFYIVGILLPYYELSSLDRDASSEVLNTLLNKLKNNNGYYRNFADEIVRQVELGNPLHDEEWAQGWSKLITDYEFENYIKGLDDENLSLTPIVDELLSQVEDFKTKIESIKSKLVSETQNPFTGEEKTSQPIIDGNVQKTQKIFSALLKINGIDIDGEELIEMGENGLEEAQKKMEEIKLQLIESEEILKRSFSNEEEYLNSTYELSKNLNEQIKNIITIPEQPVRFHYNKNDELNMGSMAVFPSMSRERFGIPTVIIPDYEISLKNQSDFIKIFTNHGIVAHEGRPGHELHFMNLKKSKNLIRKLLGVYTSFVEGWGLYSEDLVLPYLAYSSEDLAQKYYHYQFRALRAARAIADSKLYLGIYSREQAIEFLKNEVKMSEGTATAEVDRYLSSPGRDGSYFYGYIQFLNEKKKWQNELGDQFNEKCFNDSIMKIGGTTFKSISRDLKLNKVCP